MRKATFILFFLQSLFLYSQETLLKPAVWVRADSTQLSTEYWRDVTGNEHHFFSHSGFLPDAFSRINFNRSLFLEEGNYFVLPDFPLQERKITVMLVYQVEDTLLENALMNNE